jgi:DegV family protein with EDD domain
MTVAIITGSQTCLPERVLREYENITVLPYVLELDGKQFRDGIDITPEEFYSVLPSLDGFAHTSGVSPGSFLQAFEENSQRYDAILVITIASGISAVYNNALLAASSFDKVPVKVLDSGTAAMAQGLVVLKAAEASRQGADLESCFLVAKEAAEKVELLAYITTFEYLKKSGRVNAAKAFAANALSIKPVFRFKQGEAFLEAKKRSTSRAREYIADKIRSAARERGPLRVSVFHASSPAAAEALAERIVEETELEGELILSEFTPVMGAHTGPGVVGAAYL